MIMLKEQEYLSIDIETMNLSDDELAFEEQFVRAAHNTKDPAKRKAQVEKKKEDLKEKGALSNSCRIASVGLSTEGMQPLVIHTFGYNKEIKGIDHQEYRNEADMLEALTVLMNDICSEETTLVVAGRDFDFPKIRMRCVANRVQMPEVIRPGAENKIYDILFMAAKYFMIGGKFQKSLDEVALRFGVDTGGKAVSGKEVPGMIERCEFEEIILYNALDAVKNSECYKLMTGRY